MNTPTLLEYFAARETLAEHDHPESYGVNLKFYESLAGPRPDVGNWDSQPIWEWEAKWRAKLRFIRAKAMAEEAERIRNESEPKDHVRANMVHPLFGTPEWKSYVDKCWSKLESQSQVKMGAQSATTACPYPDGDKEWEAIPGNKVQPKTSNLSFSEALEAMKRGKKIRRPEWTGWLETGTKRHLGTWDILAEDWEIIT